MQQEPETDAGHRTAWPRYARAVAAALLPLSLVVHLALGRAPEWVEEHYARGLYPLVARALGAALAGTFGRLPVSAAETLLLIACLWGLAHLVRALGRLRRGGSRLGPELRAGLARLAAVAGVASALFLLLWGSNYRRLPLEERSGWEVGDPEPAELVGLCRELRDDVNALRSGLPEDEGGALELVDGVEGCLGRARLGFEAGRAREPLLRGPLARPRASLVSRLMSVVGITGIYSPFTGEPHVNAEATDAELPFTAAHEMAHGLGVAAEDEANFVAYLACRAHPDPDFRYAGALDALLYGLRALAWSGEAEEALRIGESLAPGVQRDLERIAERWARYRSGLRDLSLAMNDAYLRSMGQPHGIASYGRVVRLLLAERRARLARAASAAGPGS